MGGGGRIDWGLVAGLAAGAGLVGVLILLVLVTSQPDEPAPYERREGPRVAGVGRLGLLEYKDSISNNICLMEPSVGSGANRREARHEMRAFERLAARHPDRLIKTKVAYSDYGDVARDVTLREYAAQEAKALAESSDDSDPGVERACLKRYRARFQRIASAP